MLFEGPVIFVGEQLVSRVEEDVVLLFLSKSELLLSRDDDLRLLMSDEESKLLVVELHLFLEGIRLLLW